MLDECEFAYWSKFTGRHPGFEGKTEGTGITSNFVQKLSTLLHDPDQFCPSWSFFGKKKPPGERATHAMDGCF